MATTYTLISSVTVGSGGAANMDFTSIPATYTDLLVKVSARQSGSSGTMFTRFNNSSSNYSMRTLYGNGTSAGSQNASSQAQIDPLSNAANVNWSATTASTFSNFEIYIPNYTSSNNKSASIDVVVEQNATNGFQLLEATLWSDSSVIDRITFIPCGVETFVQYSTAYLYGISNA
jgi:hypothetical protein